MKWFQVDSDTPDDPKIKAIYEAVGPVGMCGLFFLWCFVARYGVYQPGWSLDANGDPIAESLLIAGSKLSQKRFAAVLERAIFYGHVSRSEWEENRVIVFPAMVKRADNYTKRQTRAGSKTVRTRDAQSPHSVRHTKTVQIQRTNTVRARSARTGQAEKKATPGTGYRRVLRVARDVVGEHPNADFGSLKDFTKAACAAQSVDYDADVVGKAVESAMAIRAKGRRA